MIMKLPVVSIIVPVYKVEQYLRRCLDSLIGQTLKDIEVICVDDGSPDDSYRIIEEYALVDPRIKIIRKENGGLSSARNAGLKEATAPYIAFVDSDDWVAPELFEVASKIMLSDSSLDFIHWGFAVYLEEKDCIDREETLNRNPLYSGRHSLTDEVKWAANPTAWSKLYKADIIKEKQLVFPEGLLYEDTAFWWKYSLHANCGYFIDDLYYFYLIRSSSIMGETSGKRLKGNIDHLLIVKLILDYYRQNGAFDQHAKLMKALFIEMALRGYKYTDKPEHYRKIVLEAIREQGWIGGDFKTLLHKLNLPQDYDRPKYTPLERLFSIKNFGDRKVIRLFGLPISIRRKRRVN